MHLIGKSMHYTDIVFVALTLFLLCMLQSMRNILKRLMRCFSVYTIMALWSKWNLPGECPRQNDVLNAMAKKLQSLPPACICTSIKWTEMFCSLVASQEFDTLGWVIVCKTGWQILDILVLTTHCRDCNPLGTHIMKDLNKFILLNCE